MGLIKAEVAELADAHGSGPCDSNIMRVQVPSSAQIQYLFKKSTEIFILCTFFKNKDGIVSFLSLKSMEMLKELLSDALKIGETSKDRFPAMCSALAKYQHDYPDFFDRSLRYIQVGQKNDNEWLTKTYQVGEEVNQIISQYISWGINRGELAGTTDYFETIMHMWGMISGVIKLASEKEDYIRIRGDKSKEEFLQIGFKKIYKAIAKEPSQ